KRIDVSFWQHLDLPKCEEHHTYQKPAMAEPRNLTLPENSGAVTNGDFDNFKVELHRAQYQVKIAKWVEWSKILAPSGQTFVVFAGQRFRTAQGIGEALVQHITEQ